jgi:glycerol-3-phosphate dehydrogenase
MVSVDGRQDVAGDVVQGGSVMEQRDERPESNPVLILGAGVNGASTARELVLNGVPVWLVDRRDLSWGATSRSSRLIHGGLRYLEYGEFRLVRESLQERSRLLDHAPHLIEPLRLAIPVTGRFGGLWQSARRFLFGRSGATKERGLWLVRIGLWMYDRFVKDPRFPGSRARRVGEDDLPEVDPRRFRWLCTYSDGHIRYPERWVVAVLDDARRIAEQTGTEFRVFTYHQAERDGDRFTLRPTDGDEPVPEDAISVRPALVVNATGAWGDRTLQALDVREERLFGGTKGSHFFTTNRRLRGALGPGGLYAEAADGRLVFVLPFGQSVMVGTTDEPFDGPPGEAVASEHELDYLLGMVNELFDGVALTRADVTMHYAGVRPLPREHKAATAVSRDHAIHRQTADGLTVLTLVGGKLTTARAFGEQVTDHVLSELGRPRTADTKGRPLPGAADYPPANAVTATQHELAESHAVTPEQVATVWSLCGTEAREFFASHPGPLKNLDGTHLPLAFARRCIEREWARTLSDLVERRLILVYDAEITETCLRQLAELLVEIGRLDADGIDEAIEACAARLAEQYGKPVRRTGAAMTAPPALTREIPSSAKR